MTSRAFFVIDHRWDGDVLEIVFSPISSTNSKDINFAIKNYLSSAGMDDELKRWKNNELHIKWTCKP